MSFWYSYKIGLCVSALSLACSFDRSFMFILWVRKTIYYMLRVYTQYKCLARLPRTHYNNAIPRTMVARVHCLSLSLSHSLSSCILYFLLRLEATCLMFSSLLLLLFLFSSSIALSIMWFPNRNNTVSLPHSAHIQWKKWGRISLLVVYYGLRSTLLQFTLMYVMNTFFTWWKMS